MPVEKILFYRTPAGKCPVGEFLDNLKDEQVAKIIWVLKLIRELDRVPANFLKKLECSEDIWEIRAGTAGNIFRLLGFFDTERNFILTNSFQKKSRKTPSRELRLAEKRRKEFLTRKKKDG